MTGFDFDDHWENAPTGNAIAHPDGRIIRANATLANWLGYERNSLHGKLITDLLTVGGRVHYDTHFRAILRMSGKLDGVTVDFLTADGARLPIFLSANMKFDAEGHPELMRVSAVDAKDRRSYERELLAQRERAETERRRVQVFAETLRRSLLPPLLAPPPGLDAAAYYHTASDDDVGGDFYDLFPLSRSTWGFFLGDVAGKGVDAAVVAGLARYVLRSAAVADHDPVKALHVLNSVLMQDVEIGGNRLCTVIDGNLTMSGDGFDVEVASGGHPPPLLLSADGSAHYADTVGGHAAGITDDARFVAHKFHLAPGDTMVLYTDGLTEANTGIGRRRYDDEGALLAFLDARAPATADTVVHALKELLTSFGRGLKDDAAVLALGVPAIA
ncbi:histidine kinase [Mycolicibacterium novocastrense]|uniref:SpoIIE family protein phosphatase n=1 Tax=Mycolicibacterium novocastrense TaxID=59813 RepID=UPI0007468B39|nr:SpoIIE family protein phosphatase [Mycolicibacterium novocastrense]KUH68262.1 histidine kinase [Mycolicibacterium novocastrense]KUH68860.1 histidine kinase [Mycolicibacterium novocastrense]KUH76293.1 histidine kinase [Mycolicibacterium novocastrense]